MSRDLNEVTELSWKYWGKNAQVEGGSKHTASKMIMYLSNIRKKEANGAEEEGAQGTSRENQIKTEEIR